MIKKFDKGLRRFVLAGVALSCFATFTPQTASATSTFRQGSDILIVDNNRVWTNQKLAPLFMRTKSFAAERQGRPGTQDSAMYREYGTGVAAGEGMLANVSLFTSLSYSNVDDNFSGAKYDADTLSVSYGGDYTFMDNMIFGLSGGYSDTETDTTFNGGKSDTNAWTISPYAAYVISDMFSIDAAGGYSEADSENSRIAGAARITGDQDSDSHFFAVNGRVSKWFNNIGLNGHVGYTYSKTNNDSMTESNATFVASSKNTFEQLSIGAQASYYYENFLPYLSLVYQNELGKNQIAGLSKDDDEFVFTQGVTVLTSGNFSGGLLVSETLGRSHFDGITVSGNLNFAF